MHRLDQDVAEGGRDEEPEQAHLEGFRVHFRRCEEVLEWASGGVDFAGRDPREVSRENFLEEAQNTCGNEDV